MTDCNCPTAPLLSGPGFANLTKPKAEAVLSEVDWCVNIPAGAVLSDQAWVVTPATTPPLVAADQGLDGTKTSALISGGSFQQVYRVIASVTAQVEDAAAQILNFTLWVYVPGDNAPAVFVPCEEE